MASKISSKKNVAINGASEDYNLELVQVLFRHGDRTPDKSEIYPEDPYKTFDFKPFGYGQLTNSGKRRCFKLGKILKNRYESFIGQYDPETLYTYTTFFNRCKMSLQLVLAGMFPPTPELTWNENLKWIPIPFEFNAPEDEIFYFAFRNPKFPELIHETLETPEIKKVIKKYDKILDQIVEKTGLTRKFQALSILFQNLESKKSFGLPIPDWCDNEVQKELKSAHEVLFDIYSHSTLSKKLLIGKFLEKIIFNINENNNKTNNLKFYLYSAHDISVHSFLRAHNVNDIKHINYSAAVVLEKLRGKDDKQYVRLLYWSGDSEQFEILKLKDCDEICPYEKYLEIINPMFFKEGEETFSLKEGEKINWWTP